MKRSFLISAILACSVLSIAAFLQASGIVPAIVPALSPSTSRRGTTTPASGAGIFQLAANTTAGSAGAAICDDGTGNATTTGCTTNAVTSTTPVTVNTNVTTDQQLMELSLSAGYLNSLGRPFSMFGAGVYTTQAMQTPTLNFKIKLCTVSGCGSGTVVTLVSITSGITIAASSNISWNLSATAVTAATGATGNLEIHGPATVDLGSALSTAATVYNDTNTAVSSNIDLTAALFVDFTVAFSTNAATANICTQREGVVSPGGSTAGGGGGTGAVTQISQTILGSPAASVTFSGIAGTFTDLLLTIQARSSTASTQDTVLIQLNADTGANYDTQANNTSNTGTTSGGQILAGTSMNPSSISAASSPANMTGSAQFLFLNYAGTTFDKTMLASYGLIGTASALSNGASWNQWRSTAAVTSVKLFLGSGANFVTGSEFTLWGVK